MEGAELITFHDNHMWTYGGEGGACVPCHEALEGLSGAVEGEKLYQFVSKTPATHVKIGLKDGKLHVKAGRATLSLAWIEDARKPQYSKPKKWIPVPAHFAEALGLVSLCCAVHLTRRALTCVRIQSERIVGSDGWRIMSYELDEPLKKDIDVLVPRPGALLLSKGHNLESMSVQKDKSIWFKTKEGNYIFSRLTALEYPDVDSAMEQPDKVSKFSLPLNKLDPVLDRAKIFSGEDAIEGESYVDVKVSGKRLFIKASDGRSEYKEWIPIEKALDLSFTLNTQHLLDLVKQEKAARCFLSEELGRLWISTKKWNYVAMTKTKGITEIKGEE